MQRCLWHTRQDSIVKTRNLYLNLQSTFCRCCILQLHIRCAILICRRSHHVVNTEQIFNLLNHIIHWLGCSYLENSLHCTSLRSFLLSFFSTEGAKQLAVNAHLHLQSQHCESTNLGKFWINLQRRISAFEYLRACRLLPGHSLCRR